MEATIPDGRQALSALTEYPYPNVHRLEAENKSLKEVELVRGVVPGTSYAPTLRPMMLDIVAKMIRKTDPFIL